MGYILKHELKMNMKNLLIWSLVVGGFGFCCLLMYQSMEEEMAQMADSFSQMGAFSDVFGMSTLSIATLIGYFATEIGTMHGLGGAMFAAILATAALAKEEEGHTGEFLYSLPVSRARVLLSKYLSVAINLVLFGIICGCLYAGGFLYLGEELPVKDFMLFMLLQLLLEMEIAAICLIFSSVCHKTMVGAGLGTALILYMFDVMGRAVPDMKDLAFISPFSYGNAAEIFSGQADYALNLCFGIAVLVIAGAFAFYYYIRRDLEG